METLPAFLDSLAARRPDAEVIAHAPSAVVATRLSWSDLVHQSRDAARRLIGVGVNKGSRVGFLCPNRAEWLPIAFGILRTGGVLVPFSTLWKRDEMAYALKHADVDTFLLVPAFLKHDYLASLRDVVPEIAQSTAGHLFSASVASLRRVIVIGDRVPGTFAWNELPVVGDEAFLAALEAALTPADWATIFFTSGTTAAAKAVLHTHGALTTSARRIAPCFGITEEDAWWGHMPLFWSGGFVLGALATMAGGGRIVLQETVDAGSALELLESERCTIMAGWHQAGPLLDHPELSSRRLHLKKGTYHALAQRLLGQDHRAIGVYGMSETATCVSASRWDDPEEIRCGTFGRPLDGMEIRIVDPESGTLVGSGETGEILVKGPTLMEGYYRVPRPQTLDAQGFFRTGDLGFLDTRGYLHFATRLKEVIKTAGVNVAAVEIEEALARHPGVKAAYVVGVPHPTRGENVASFVVTTEGNQPTEDDLRRFCKSSLASYKVPRHVFFIREEEVPRTGSGKVEKPVLRRLAVHRLGAQ
jgi:fatty-acyl-CoA synthase